MPTKLEQFSKVLEEQGVDAALAVLNAGIPHRYTGIFELKGDCLLNRHIYDKAGEPKNSYLDVVPFTDSFCQLVLRDGEFRTENTHTDSRVDYSPYKGIVVSYQGVPIVDKARQLYGTLCHFDVVERALDDAEFSNLVVAAHLLPGYVLGR